MKSKKKSIHTPALIHNNKGFIEIYGLNNGLNKYRSITHVLLTPYSLTNKITKSNLKRIKAFQLAIKRAKQMCIGSTARKNENLISFPDRSKPPTKTKSTPPILNDELNGLIAWGHDI